MSPSEEVFWREDVKLWWPVADGDPVKAYNFVMKRVKDSDLAVKLCKKRSVCVQAGSYVGLWPKRLAKSFALVWTFEVMPGCFEAARRNLESCSNVFLSNWGLGSTHGITAPLLPKGTAGSWRIDPEGQLSANLTCIDKLPLKSCDAIFLDIEGYEVEALKGAKETIAKYRPVIHVEELPRSKEAIQRHLRELGYKEFARIHADAVYVPT